jgi:hypothetical protein
MERDPGVYRFERFSDVDLFQLAEIAREEDYERLAEWIMSHKDRELAARGTRLLDRRKKAYEELLTQLLASVNRIGAPARFGFARVPRNTSDISAVADRMLGMLDENEIDKDQARALISHDSYRRLAKLLAAGGPSNSSPQVVTDYERRLREDNMFLLEELVTILTTEYDRRVVETRRRFEEYLGPHQRVLDGVRREIREINADLERLERDTHLLPEERAMLQSAFAAKKAELQDIERVEAFKLKKIEFLCLTLRDGVEQFRVLIDSLQAKLDSYRSRQSYVDKLARLGARIPEFRQLLTSLYESFQRNLAGLQKGFLVFDRSFQEMVLSTVDSESVVSRVVLAPPSVVKAELEIVNPPFASRPQASEEPAEEVNLDLSFLQEYRYRN